MSYTQEDINKAKNFLDNQGYGTGTNFTLDSVACLMAQYALENKPSSTKKDCEHDFSDGCTTGYYVCKKCGDMY